MEDFTDTDFPNAFGESPVDFAKNYSHLVHEVINEKTLENKKTPKSPKLEVENLSHGFFILISKDNFRKLRRYRGEGSPHNYMRKILQNYIFDRLTEEKPKIEVQFELTDQSLEGLKGKNIPENVINLLKKLGNKPYKSERKFTNALTQIIGEGNTDTYKPVVLIYG